MTAIRIALVDDHRLFRKGLAALLADMPGLSVVLEASHGAELLAALPDVQADVVMLDISMPVMDGIETLKQLRSRHPALKVIMLSMNEDDAMIVHLMGLGANGYLLKEAQPEEVETAIRSVMASGYFLNERVSRAMLSRLVKPEKVKPSLHGSTISDREMDVLLLVCHGLTTQEIGDRLFISPRTVEGHRKNMMEKLGIHNTASLVIFAIKQGWIDPDEIHLRG
jgi:two-component system response regulator DegU